MANHQPDRLVVPLSKAKLGLTLVGSAAFVAVGIWLWSIAAQNPRRTPLLVGTAILGVGFFGFCGVYALFKLFDATPGFVIDGDRIVDNSSGVSAGRIPWSDIQGFHVTTVQGQRFLTVDVHNPQKYIKRANVLKRFIVSMNAKYFGGPIQVSANALKINFEELIRVANESVEKHRRA